MQPLLVNQTDVATFLSALESALSRRKSGSHGFGLLVAQVENLEHLRTTIGYKKTLPYLALLAEKLGEIFDETGTIVRFCESKFGIFVNELKNEGHLALAGSKILRELKGSVDVDGRLFAAHMRVGAATASGHMSDPDLLLQQAETALLTAREDGEDFAIFDSGQTRRLTSLLGLENEIDLALEQGELAMFYQPKVAAADRRPVSAEALIRWASPTRGFVPPDVFIPIADAKDRIEALTWFAFNTALRQSNEWPANYGDLSVAINVTPNIVEGADLVGLLNSTKGMWDVPASRIIVEVTENTLMRPDACFNKLSALREAGARVSIDDFGTGYSSLAYFNTIPADELKIDKSFVTNMLDNEGYGRIVRTIINLAHSFGLSVTAEGVEDEETAQALAKLGCDTLQGTHFSWPLPQPDFIKWLKDYKP